MPHMASLPVTAHPQPSEYAPPEYAPPGSAPPGYRDAPVPEWDAGQPVDIHEAEEFIRACHAELPKLGPAEPRIKAVRDQIAALGSYVHTRAELIHGARMAWRNASRCIGRVYWRGLVVLDRRGPRDEEQIFGDLISHLRLATGEGPRRGQLRPVISIFGQSVPGRPTTRIWNDQLIRYAGYRTDAGVTGDPRYERFTRAVNELGWAGKGSAFDLLPLVMQTGSGEPRLFELPESSILEVPLAHPEHSWFAELGLRWHAVPAISNMRLEIGGVSYPLAPFSGWYMGAEIGARNLADPDRYNQIPVIAARLGLDTSRESTLWRDRALVELNRAVLWSFEKAGVRVTDHHTESRLFLTHLDREERAGRHTPADWTWIVPPISGGLTPVFHRYYAEADQRPNFYLDALAQRLAQADQSGGPYAGGAETAGGSRTAGGSGIGRGAASAGRLEQGTLGQLAARVGVAVGLPARGVPTQRASEHVTGAVCPVTGQTAASDQPIAGTASDTPPPPVGDQAMGETVTTLTPSSQPLAQPPSEPPRRRRLRSLLK
jgi:nitric-oxide synthase